MNKNIRKRRIRKKIKIIRNKEKKRGNKISYLDAALLYQSRKPKNIE
jgi:hypothetical protein